MSWRLPNVYANKNHENDPHKFKVCTHLVHQDVNCEKNISLCVALISLTDPTDQNLINVAGHFRQSDLKSSNNTVTKNKCVATVIALLP